MLYCHQLSTLHTANLTPSIHCNFGLGASAIGAVKTINHLPYTSSSGTKGHNSDPLSGGRVFTSGEDGKVLSFSFT